MRSCGIHLRPFSGEMLKISIMERSLKITNLGLQAHIPRANELNTFWLTRWYGWGIRSGFEIYATLRGQYIVYTIVCVRPEYEYVRSWRLQHNLENCPHSQLLVPRWWKQPLTLSQSPYAAQMAGMPAVNVVQGNCQWPMKMEEIPTSHVNHEAILTNIETNQSQNSDAS